MRTLAAALIALVLSGCASRHADKKDPQKAPLSRAEALLQTADQFASSGRFEQAEDAYRQALAAGGGDEMTEAKCRQALAALLSQSGRLVEAERLLREAVALSERRLGSTHDDTLLASAMLADVLRAAGKFDEAEALYRRVMKAWENQQDADKLAAALTGLAATLAETEDPQSQELFARAKSVLEKRHGPGCVELIAVLDQEALLAANRREWAQAIAAKTSALEIIERNGGTDRREYVGALNEVIALNAEAGDWKRAIELNRTAIAILERAMGPNDPNLAVALQNCAFLLRQSGNTAEADELAKRADGIARRE